MRAALLFLAGLLLAAPAPARRRPHKPAAPPPARVEDDPRKKGDSPAFARSRISFTAPRDLSQIEAKQPVTIGLEVHGYAVGALQPGGPVPHLHLIVDNEPAFEVSDLSAPLRLTGLAPGPHLLRAVLCRPWHEVVKAPRAFAMARFWVGPKLEGKAGRAAEYVAWPDPRRPILTYVLPIGHVAQGLTLARAGEHHSDPGEDTPLPPPTPGANRAVVDFYLSHAKLARRGDKLRVVLDRRELPLLTEWKPHHLRRARGGTHRVTIDLLNRKGLWVKNAFNRTSRVFTVGH